MIKFTAGFL